MTAATATTPVTSERPGRARPGSTGSTAAKLRATRLVLFGGLLIVLFVGPLAWMLSTSFKSSTEMANPELTLIPRSLSNEGYDRLFGSDQTQIWRWVVNSLVTATLTSALVLVTASLAAYALARLDFPGKRLVTAIILATLFVPPISLLIPNWIIVERLDWLNKPQALIVPAAAGAFGVFFLRQFFSALPRELEEAAVLDGASRMRIFVSVIVPLSRPALATLALLTFLGSWNDFLWPLSVLYSNDKLTLQPGLSTLNSAMSTDYATIMAGGVIASVPVLILFAISQRFVIEGVARSGVKG